MFLTPDQFDQIAAWQSAFPGFDRDDDSTIRDRILPGVKKVEESGKWKVRIVHSGGMENFYAITIRPSTEPKSTIHNVYPRSKGLLVYFSLLSPYAAVSRAEVLAGEDIWDDAKMAISDVIVPGNESDEVIVTFLRAFENSGYMFLDSTTLGERLPDDVKIEGFCYGAAAAPYDRVFHLLFHAND